MTTATPVMPTAFIGHGSPMNALERNRHTSAWQAYGRTLTKPRAVLAISAHWYLPGVAVTAMPKPRTIHDFGGFPAALQAFDYPAPGSPALALRVQSMLSPLAVQLDEQWGLDHGTWSVLTHIFPDADVPVVQLAIDRTKPPQFHYDLGRRLSPLRDEGVLILGLGNVVHNLGRIQWGGQSEPMPWAAQFNDAVRSYVQAGNHGPLINYESMGEMARLSVPTPEHYLPLLYVIGAQQESDRIMTVTDGLELGSISMLSWTTAKK